MTQVEHEFWSKVRQHYAQKSDAEIPFFKSWFLDWQPDLGSEIPSTPGATPDELKQEEVLKKVSLYRFHEYGNQYDNEVHELLFGSKNFDKWFSLLKQGEPKEGHTQASYERAKVVSSFGKIETTAWRLKAIHHWLSFETLLDESIDDYDTIIEFGAGSAELARTLFDSGWEGRYIIIDFPELWKFQQFYLSGNHVEWYETINSLPLNFKKALFVSTWGFSETPVVLRRELTKCLKDRVDSWALLYQKVFKDVNNVNYFMTDFPLATETFYRIKGLTFHKTDGGNLYQVCKKSKPIKNT